MFRLTDRPDMTLDVYRGRKTTMQQQQQQQQMLEHETPCLGPKSALVDRHSSFVRSLAGLLKTSAFGIVFIAPSGHC